MRTFLKLKETGCLGCESRSLTAPSKSGERSRNLITTGTMMLIGQGQSDAMLYMLRDMFRRIETALQGCSLRSPSPDASAGVDIFLKSHASDVKLP